MVSMAGGPTGRSASMLDRELGEVELGAIQLGLSSAGDEGLLKKIRDQADPEPQRPQVPRPQGQALRAESRA